MKHEAHAHCMNALNRKVRIQVRNGRVHDGIVVNVDDHYVYLRMPAWMAYGYGSEQAFRNYPYNPYNSYYNDVILPLVLFDLLAITLL